VFVLLVKRHNPEFPQYSKNFGVGKVGVRA
jgi:hypothetical protein